MANLAHPARLTVAQMTGTGAIGACAVARAACEALQGASAGLTAAQLAALTGASPATMEAIRAACTVDSEHLRRAIAHLRAAGAQD